MTDITTPGGQRTTYDYGPDGQLAAKQVEGVITETGTLDSNQQPITKNQ